MSETEKQGYVERRRKQDDAFMKKHNIGSNDYIEYDWGQVGEYYITEWKLKG